MADDVVGRPPGLLPLPTVAHLVVTERATGRTVHRRPVDSGEAGGILAHVHERMASTSPEHFRSSLDDLYRSPVAGPKALEQPAAPGPSTAGQAPT